MEEVSSRIFRYYAEAAERRGVSRDVLTAGLSSIERVVDGARWYDWADHVRMLGRFEAAVGGPDVVDRIALESSERRVADPLRVLARSLADISLVYRAAFWFSSSLYRHVTFSVRPERQLLHVTITIPERYEGSDVFFRMWRGTLRGTPRMLGLPDATVIAEQTSHRGTFDVLVPEGRDVWARARRVFEVASPSRTLLGHLESHDRELRAAYDALLESQRAVEGRLRRSEQDKQAMLEAIPDLVVRIDRHGIVVSVGGQSVHPIAPLLRSHVGKPFRSPFGEDAQLPSDLAERLAQGALAAHPEAFVLETPSSLGGEQVHLEWRSVALVGGDVVCLVRDLSRQRRMEAELAVAERLASLGMLAAGVGHEINNPLAYLLLQLRLFERAAAKGRPTSELATHVVAALEGAGHIERIVRSLKALAERVPADHHPVDVNAVIDDILKLTQNRLPAGTTVRRDYAVGLYASADEAPLGQVFTNVIVNAADAIASSGAGKGEIHISTRAARGAVEIEVSDNGVGMDPEAIRRAFDPFYTTKAPKGGLGLGLTLTHRMVRVLGGTIAVEPRGGAGAGMRVTVRLPRAEGGAIASARAPDSPSGPETSPRFDGASVLVIDDQPNLVVSLRMLLDECVVTGASCGQEGLRAILGETFDLVLCDIVMPDVDGLGIFESVERQSPSILPRLVFMTGGVVRPEIGRFLTRIPNPCLQKPFTEQQLRQVMATRLQASTSG